jgi:phage major head subunit gpT-like protein
MADLALAQNFVFNYEKRMRATQEDEYARALMSVHTWWPKIAKTLNIDGASERLTWFLNTAEIRPVGLGGNVPFESLVTATTELVPQRYASAIKVFRDQLLDLRGGGLDILADWSRQIGNKTAYYPQRLISELIMNGAATDGSATAYDGVPYFASQNTTSTIGGVSVIGHPYNPWRPLLGGYINWMTGAPGTYTQPNGAVVSYPGACPIDTSVTIDVAFQNLAALIAFVGSLKMPDGITPRFLRPRALLVPPALVPRAAELTGAYFIAQGATGGAGSGDVRATIQRWGLDGPPIEVQEFASTTNYVTKIMQANQSATGQPTGVQTAYTETIKGSDTTYYLVMEQNMSSQLGGIIHVVRESFRTNYFTGDGQSGQSSGVDAILNRELEIEYICQGRLSGQYGHPYGIIRADKT